MNLFNLPLSCKHFFMLPKDQTKRLKVELKNHLTFFRVPSHLPVDLLFNLTKMIGSVSPPVNKNAVPKRKAFKPLIQLSPCCYNSRFNFLQIREHIGLNKSFELICFAAFPRF